jgi:hypothetical protein
MSNYAQNIRSAIILRSQAQTQRSDIRYDNGDNALLYAIVLIRAAMMINHWCTCKLYITPITVTASYNLLRGLEATTNISHKS